MPNDDIQFKSPSTGKVQTVPPEHWDEALNQGYTPTTHKVMYSPDGQRGMVPNAELRDYAKRGYQTTRETSVEAARRKSTGVMGALKGMLPSDPTGGHSPLEKEFWLGAPSFNPTGPGTAYHALTRPLPKDLPTGKVGGSAVYRGASLVAPLAGVDPESMEAASEHGDTASVATQAAVPAALALAGPHIAKVLPSPRNAVGKFIYTPEGRVMGLKEAAIRKGIPDPYAPTREAKAAGEAKAKSHMEFAKRVSDIEDARQKELADWGKLKQQSESEHTAHTKNLADLEKERQQELADWEKFKEQHAESLMRRGAEQAKLEKGRGKGQPPPPPAPPGTTPTTSPTTPSTTKSSILSRGSTLYSLGEEPNPSNPVHVKIINDLQTRSGTELRAMAKNGDRFAAFVLRNMPRPKP